MLFFSRTNDKTNSVCVERVVFEFIPCYRVAVFLFVSVPFLFLDSLFHSARRRGKLSADEFYTVNLIRLQNVHGCVRASELWTYLCDSYSTTFYVQSSKIYISHHRMRQAQRNEFNEYSIKSEKEKKLFRKFSVHAIRIKKRTKRYIDSLFAICDAVI